MTSASRRPTTAARWPPSAARLLGLPEAPEDGGEFDLVVVGGGIAGTCAALSAARLGLKVALVQDRPVLGGNNSSEVRVWLNGGINLPPYPRVGDIVAELEPEQRRTSARPTAPRSTKTTAGWRWCASEKNITLFLKQRVNAVEAHGRRSFAPWSPRHIRTARRMRLAARWFADCTGDGTVGSLAGADFDMTEKRHMGPSNLWNVQDAGQAEPFPKCECEDTNAVNMAFASTAKTLLPFPRCPWALDLRDKAFPGPAASHSQGGEAVRSATWAAGSGRAGSTATRSPTSSGCATRTSAPCTAPGTRSRTSTSSTRTTS